MLHFDSDYMEGCHPSIMNRLATINLDKNTGYGLDPYCESARQKIRKACAAPHANVQFLVGGTQTNMVLLDAMLKFNDGVIACDTGHINVHEAGAIEACGHKVMPVKAQNGKIDILALESYLEAFYRETAQVGIEHYVMPKVVYISSPTELGTLYSLAELEQLRALCDRYGLLLYMDGARMGYGLTAPGGDLTLPHIARLCDAFYIGGTKVGALMGEVAVVTNPAIELTRGLIKHRGAMLAKGWVLGVQFDTLFTHDLYFEISRHANDMAMLLRHELEDRGYRTYIDSPTNQQFFVIDNAKAQQLSTEVSYSYIAPLDGDSCVIRFATSWATTREQVEALVALL